MKRKSLTVLMQGTVDKCVRKLLFRLIVINLLCPDSHNFRTIQIVYLLTCLLTCIYCMYLFENLFIPVAGKHR